MNLSQNFMSFRVDSALGKFTAYVKVSEGMSELDARTDALSLAQSAFHGSARVSEQGQRIASVPEDAWSESAAQGWGWVARGHREPPKPREQSVVLVPSTGMEDFEASLSRLNKKAIGFGLEPIKVLDQITRCYYWEHTDTSRGTDAVLKRLRQGEDTPGGQAVWLVNELTLEYPIIKLGEWTVVGQIEAADGGNLLFCISQDPADVERMSSFAQCPIGCEHCNTKRQRKLSYLLRDEQGEYKQVGSTCLEDFTGIDPAAVLFMQKMSVFYAGYQDELGASGDGRVTGFPVRTYLARVSFCIEQAGGFMSSTKARELGIPATYDDAMLLDVELKSSEALRLKFYESYDRHVALATEVIEWWEKQSADDTFAHNVKTLLGGEIVSMKRQHLAFAAAAIPGYQRHLSREIEASMPSAHIGREGEKRIEPLSVQRVSSWETVYGTQTLISLLDASGNRIAWRTASPPAELLQTDAVGKPFNAQFKIKKHDEYKGVASTGVSHLKFKGWCAELAHTDPARVAIVTVSEPTTAAFEDVGVREEVSNILRALCEEVDAQQVPCVRDTNGNVVGSMVLADAMPMQPVSDGHLRVWLALDEQGSPKHAMELIAAGLCRGQDVFYDDRGNVIGELHGFGSPLACETVVVDAFEP